MQTIDNTKFKIFRNNGRELRMMWDVLTISTPEGARVIVSDMSRPIGTRVIFDEQADEGELADLKARAHTLIMATLQP